MRRKPKHIYEPNKIESNLSFTGASMKKQSAVETARDVEAVKDLY